ALRKGGSALQTHTIIFLKCQVWRIAVSTVLPLRRAILRSRLTELTFGRNYFAGCEKVINTGSSFMQNQNTTSWTASAFFLPRMTSCLKSKFYGRLLRAYMWLMPRRRQERETPAGKKFQCSTRRPGKKSI